MVFHHKKPNQRKGGYVIKKTLKNGNRGNRKEWLVAYEEMSVLKDHSTRVELIQMLFFKPWGEVAVGVKGFRSALYEKAVIQRFQWRKRENILKFLDKSHQSNFHRKLQPAYEQSTYEVAKKKLSLHENRQPSMSLPFVAWKKIWRKH